MPFFPAARHFAALLALLALAPPALADLMLHPTRLVFDKNQRSAQVELINNGSETATYRITLVNRRMTENGDFLPVDAPGPGEQFADAMLRYSPRQVTLAPGTAQTVRVLLRKPAELANGEYRSHLHFEVLPEARGATSIESQGKGDEIGIVLNTAINASIPVIVRQGATSASVALSGLALIAGAPGQPPLLGLDIERSGNASVYGDLTASFVPQNGGAEQVLVKISGLAVYHPNPVRHAKLVLKPAAGTQLAHGTIKLVFRERPEAGGKLIAQASLALP
jgi:P pilus assembly chaperone PapD